MPLQSRPARRFFRALYRAAAAVRGAREAWRESAELADALAGGAPAELLWCSRCGGDPFPVSEGTHCPKCDWRARPSHFRGEE